MTTVQVDANGVRTVTRQDEYGESWSRYTIVPRRLMLRTVRKLRARGRRWADIESWEVMPEPPGGFSYFASCGGASWFASEPACIKRTRKFYVFLQFGGRDV